MVFVSAARKDQQKSITVDAAGKFGVTLASGGWLVYLGAPGEKPVFHSRIDVRDNEPRQVTLVTR